MGTVAILAQADRVSKICSPGSVCSKYLSRHRKCFRQACMAEAEGASAAHSKEVLHWYTQDDLFSCTATRGHYQKEVSHSPKCYDSKKLYECGPERPDTH